MLRRSFTFASAISLLLCIATGVLWVATYGDAFAVGFKTREAVTKQIYLVPIDYRVVSANGHLWLQRRRGVFGMPPDLVAKEYPSKAGEKRWSLNRVDEKFPFPRRGRPCWSASDSFKNMSHGGIKEALTPSMKS